MKTGSMHLREKIDREAFAKKDVKPLLSHLKAITLTNGGGRGVLR